LITGYELLFLFVYLVLRGLSIFQKIKYVSRKIFNVEFITSLQVQIAAIPPATIMLYYFFGEWKWLNFRWYASEGYLFFSGVILTAIYFKITSRNGTQKTQDQIELEWHKHLMKSDIIRIK